MANFPSAIIFVNNDLTPNIQSALVRQLFITDTMTGSEFDARIVSDPNYSQIVYFNNLRVLVIRDFADGYNRDLADIAIFVKAGLATIESNKNGPPSQTFSVDKLTIYELLKHYPISGTRPVPADVQDNILVPINPNRNKPQLYPFGSDIGGKLRGGRGADVGTPEDE